MGNPESTMEDYPLPSQSKTTSHLHKKLGKQKMGTIKRE